MYRRVRLKRRYIKKHHFHIKIKKKNIIFLTIISLLIMIIMVFNFINKKVNPILMKYAKAKATNIATLVITEAVNNEIFKQLDTDKLFTTKSTNKGQSTDLNSAAVNKLLNDITNHVQNYLKKLSSGDIDKLKLSENIFDSYDKKNLRKGVIYKIPSGIVLNNSLLANLGPKIPVKINLVGDVISDVKTKVKNYGINNALLEVTVYIEVKVSVILPFSSETVRAKTSLPLVLKLVEGEVPNMYYGIASNSK